MDATGLFPVLETGDPVSEVPVYTEMMLEKLGPPWQKLTLANGATEVSASGYAVGGWWRIIGDVLQLRGMVKPGTNTVFGNLPTVARPKYNCLLPAILNGSSVGCLYVTNATGTAPNIAVLFGSATSYIHLCHNIPLN